MAEENKVGPGGMNEEIDLSKYEKNATVMRLATNNWFEELESYLTRKYSLDFVTCMETVTALIAKHNQGSNLKDNMAEKEKEKEKEKGNGGQTDLWKWLNENDKAFEKVKDGTMKGKLGRALQKLGFDQTDTFKDISNVKVCTRERLLQELGKEGGLIGRFLTAIDDACGVELGEINELIKQLSLAIERAMTKGSNKKCFVMYVGASVSRAEIRQALLNVQFKGGAQVRKVVRTTVTDELKDESESQDTEANFVNEIIVECESRIEQVIRDMFDARGWQILGGHDSKYAALYSGVVVPVTEASLAQFEGASDVVVDMAIQQSEFSDQLKLRDEHCRVHGEACQSKYKSLSGGHLFDENEALYKPAAMRKKKWLVYSVVNGYLWCREFENEWGKRSVCIDPNDGYLSFTPDFNYEAANIIPGARIALAKFGQDCKEKDENDIYGINDELKDEPTQGMITAYHNEIFLGEREEIVKKAWLCPGCKSRFGEEKDAKQHMNKKGCIGKAIKDATTCACSYCDDARTLLQLLPNEKPRVLPNQRRQQLEAAQAKDLNMNQALPSAVSTNDDDTCHVD